MARQGGHTGLLDKPAGVAQALAPLRAMHTPNFPAILRLGALLLVTTYQAGKLVLACDEGAHLDAPTPPT